uniref:Ankyrin repeat domain-containing protein SOWAHC-like n=1 Tax=Gouania willdenowi TaxID=441366 RepID=A0A8C5DTL9_GOUWI
MEFTEEHIVDFLRMNGGKVMSSVLLEHFKTVFPAEPELRAAVRAQFKSCVDRVAFVKSGTKYVCLRKKFLINPLCETEVADKASHASFHKSQLSRRRHSLMMELCSTCPNLQPLDPQGSAMLGLQGQAVCQGSPEEPLRLSSQNQVKTKRISMSSADVKRLTRCDSDVSSLVSSTLEEDRTLVTLDPVEHEWMLCSSDSEWSSLQRLLVTEPSLVLRKDFVTGFTCLHWAAKHGKPELIAMIVNFAKQHHVPISVDVRSNTGYTPLHIAAMHGHMEVVKLLVGAFNADVEIRDYSGKKACQYLTNSASLDIRDIVGAYETQETDDSHHKDTPRWKLAQILQANLKPTWMLNSEDCVPADREGGPREVLLRRKSSLSIMKPKFQRIRQRTSQLVHSTSFGEKKEGERAKRHSFLSRPKTHWFG